MYDTFTFNRVKTRVTRENLENGCYVSNSEEILENIYIDEDYMEQLFDPILEVFYNLLQKEGKLQ
ncbi:hypothetical protein [Clostridium tertium]|uniref:hypothetical protein n=1 Tax=Clostridium tertium TaxID=1559 RepID=UPI000BE3950A|nr:hypothetical protein [Clostridium tertium]